MAARPVEWVLVIYYGPSAHRATYGRLHGQDTKYTKDYIQLSRKDEFLDALTRLFPMAGGGGSVPLTYRWPMGDAPGALVFNSADRPHLKWETSRGAPDAWKMSLAPNEATAETIPGDPSHLDFAAAENELALLASRGAGQPYLLAVKLRDEPSTLHLRAYLQDPGDGYAWADLGRVPHDIRGLAAKTSRRSALAWSTFNSGGTAAGAKVEGALLQLAASPDPVAAVGALDLDTGRAVARYLRSPGYGLFFDPAQNHAAWSELMPWSGLPAAPADDLVQLLEARFPQMPPGDAAAEALEVDPDEVAAFRGRMVNRSYEVADSTATLKTRGSAQRVFAEAVKANYGHRCAIAGIATRDFLVASHIVPWSEDPSIRLDPSNGICLSLLMDRAFEKGYLLIEDDLTVRVDWIRVGGDQVLATQLGPYDGKKLHAPSDGAPQPAYLQRRRAFVAPAE